MNDLPAEPIGAAWLAKTFGVMPFGRLPVMSQMGGRRATQVNDGFRLETYTEPMRPASEPAAHLQFHLRHETPNLEFLSRLLQNSGPGFVQEWINSEPTGQYARRAAFLYEWLTDQELVVPPRLGGNYVDVIDDGKMVAASQDRATRSSRWHVNNNLAGTREFCPMVIKTEAVDSAAALDVPYLFNELTNEFGEDLLLRAAIWMTLRESKSSFAIEGESERVGRVQRFADVMARRTGQNEVPLGDADLAELQHEILGERSSITHFGLRQSPVFVGQSLNYQEVVHYVAPPAGDVGKMLEGLRVFLEKTEGQSSVMRSAVASFGFVYIHPLSDGNGRVHRFLVNDVLRRDGVLPAPVILPISAVITDDSGERRSYDQTLDRVSEPLMRSLRECVKFESTQTTYPDGVVSNFSFQGEDRARPLWRYPDLSPHVVFLSRIIDRTLTEQMREESRYLRNHARARSALKEVVEMPDHQADRVLRSLEQNKGQLSNVLVKEMPILAHPGIWDEIVDAVAHAFSEPAADMSAIEPYRPGRPAGG